MIDLHIHTTFSDGEYSPEKILKISAKHEINVISITDHNNLIGSQTAMKLQKSFKNLTIIPGFEMTAQCDHGQKHILGYNVNLNDDKLNNILMSMRIANVDEMHKIIALLYNRYNFSFSDEELEKLYDVNKNVGRPNIALLCVKHGYIHNTREAFFTFLKDIKKEVKNNLEIPDKKCIEYIINAGGIPSLAHPFTLKLDFNDTRLYIRKLMDYGLNCVEAYHSQQPNGYNIQMEKIVAEFGLKYSVGSDYHGPIVKPNVYIGTGINNNLCIETATIISCFK